MLPREAYKFQGSVFAASSGWRLSGAINSWRLAPYGAAIMNLSLGATEHSALLRGSYEALSCAKAVLLTK
jgi:hypothetical protein